MISLRVPMMSAPPIWRRRVDGQRRGQHVAGDDGPLVGEPLLAVDDAVQLDADVGSIKAVIASKATTIGNVAGAGAAVVRRAPVAAANSAIFSAETR